MEKETKKTPRAQQTRSESERPKVWVNSSALDAPKCPAGYRQRWIRFETMGHDDTKNIMAKLRQGWELVRGTDLPSDWELPTADEHSRHAGIVYNDGLLLAKIPNETIKERHDYYEGISRDAVGALDNTMFNETRKDGRYVKYNPQRDSRVSFGKK